MRLPNVLQTIRRWSKPVQLDVIKKELSDFDVKETTVVIQTITAVMQPSPAQKIDMKPEGQRSWKWWEIWTESELHLDWILRDSKGKFYRVMEVYDWSDARFFHYSLAETANI